MFSRATDASKVGLAWLCRHLSAWDWPLIDSQTPTPHMLAMGASEIPRERFLEQVRRLVDQDPGPRSWRLDPALHPLDSGWRQEG
jgi:leucyl/phenylalanyl-tRNA---protein transferase